MLAAACATGVVAAFGCPFGGIVFAIEVCATYFQVCYEACCHGCSGVLMCAYICVRDVRGVKPAVLL